MGLFTVLLPTADSSSPNALTHRAWVAYLRQELTAPAAALSQYARDLNGNAGQSDSPDTVTATRRIVDRAEHLFDVVQKLTQSETPPQAESDRGYWRAVRHDLRAAASYVVMSCEDIIEGAPAAVVTALKSDLQRTICAAQSVIELIEQVVNFGQNRNATPTLTGPVWEMLARLPRAGADSSAISVQALAGRILLVDDNKFNRDLVARILVGQGHTVEVVAGGREAQQRLESNQSSIDLILLDVMMPGMTGPEVLSWLKTDSRFWHLPVIMVSALGEDDSVLACIAAGAEDYLTRPVRAELLRARIVGCLEKKRLRDREVGYQARIASLVRALFPPAAVEEWERTGTIQPRHHEQVGVLFLDVVGFTSFSEKYRNEPGHVIRLLQDLVERFETTVNRHGVQKIKTIGDAFMGVAGLSAPIANPALTLLQCGLDLIADAANHSAHWQVRVGIHVGPVVTGVLGKTQFSFDVWGHTVNAASRIESNGKPGQVCLSDEAWTMLNDVAIGDQRPVAARGLGVVDVWDFERWTT